MRSPEDLAPLRKRLKAIAALSLSVHYTEPSWPIPGVTLKSILPCGLATPCLNRRQLSQTDVAFLLERQRTETASRWLHQSILSSPSYIY